MHAPLLTTDQLWVSLPQRNLCRNLSIDVHPGDFWVILGPNGAGKTTLIHTLAGLRAPDQGVVNLAGQPYSAWPRRRVPQIRGLLSQHIEDHFDASVLETVLVGRHPYIGRWGWEQADDWALARQALQQLKLTGRDHDSILKLSGGERQRVAIAALLAQAPALYLLDEPLTHLDLHHQMAVLQLFTELSQNGAAVVMVLHDLNLAARFANRILLLQPNGESCCGTVDHVLTSERLSLAFGYPLAAMRVDHHLIFLPQ